jgi:hypothetical protein
MKYSELNEEVRKIIIASIDDNDIELSDTDKSILKFIICSDICSLIMRNFKELEFD